MDEIVIKSGGEYKPVVVLIINRQSFELNLNEAWQLGKQLDAAIVRCSAFYDGDAIEVKINQAKKASE